MRILLVEDDELSAKVLEETLKLQHYLVDRATDGAVGWELAKELTYDLILLDVVLPKLDGISFCKQRRAKGDRTPILLLTAQDSNTGKVAGLDAGADDYVVKPYNIDELLARIRALLRRGNSTSTPVIEWENLRFDPSNCQVTYNGQLLHLTPKEYALLELFLRHTQRIFSQSALLDHLWPFEEPPSENAVRAHIKSLRQKLKQAGAGNLIETVYGMGYRLRSWEDGEQGDEEVKSQKSKVKSQNPKSPHSSLLAPRSSPEPPATKQLEAGMTALWERFRDKYSDRITIIEQAVTALFQGTLTEALRQQAQQQAHTLVGSLGSFGFDAAARLCREIEQTFRSGTIPNRAAVEHLSQLVSALRQTLESQPATTEPQQQTLPAKPLQNRLLIVDDDVELVTALIAAATARGMQAEGVYNLTQARETVARIRPDVVLLDLCFPDSLEHGFCLLEELTTIEPPVPVLVFTATENFAERVKAARLGSRGFLQKPVSPAQVMEAIAQVLQAPATPDAKLLVVGDDPQILDRLRLLLSPWGFQLTLLDDPQQFWHVLEQSVPDLLILDKSMSQSSSIDLCQVVRNDLRWRNLPVLFLCDRADTKTVQQIFTVGANDYVNQPIVESELLARVLNQLQRRKKSEG